MRFWQTANWVVSLATGAAALVSALAGPAFDRIDLIKPAVIVTMIGAAVVIVVRRMRDKEKAANPDS